MFPTADAFLGAYGWESDTTSKLLGALTDAAMAQEKAPGHDLNAGQLAWHIATAPLYMLCQCGFDFDPAPARGAAPASAAQIKQTYDDICAELKKQVATKTPEDLAKVYHVFGMLDWPAGMMLTVLIHHEIHHRGQLSVLMRQAGLVIPSIYGPTLEETREMEKQAAAQ